MKVITVKFTTLQERMTSIKACPHVSLIEASLHTLCLNNTLQGSYIIYVHRCCISVSRKMHVHVALKHTLGLPPFLCLDDCERRPGERALSGGRRRVSSE